MSESSFSDTEYGSKRKQARREVFLDEMQRAAPWAKHSGHQHWRDYQEQITKSSEQATSNVCCTTGSDLP